MLLALRLLQIQKQKQKTAKRYWYADVKYKLKTNEKESKRLCKYKSMKKRESCKINGEKNKSEIEQISNFINSIKKEK